MGEEIQHRKRITNCFVWQAQFFTAALAVVLGAAVTTVYGMLFDVGATLFCVAFFQERNLK